MSDETRNELLFYITSYDFFLIKSLAILIICKPRNEVKQNKLKYLRAKYRKYFKPPKTETQKLQHNFSTLLSQNNN